MYHFPRGDIFDIIARIYWQVSASPTAALLVFKATAESYYLWQLQPPHFFGFRMRCLVVWGWVIAWVSYGRGRALASELPQCAYTCYPQKYKTLFCPVLPAACALPAMRSVHFCFASLGLVTWALKCYHSLKHHYPTMASLSPFQVRILFAQFVDDVLGDDVLVTEFRGSCLAPILHHVLSQLFFLSLRAPAELCSLKISTGFDDKERNTSCAQAPGGGGGCSLRIDFVGKLEETEDHWPILLRHLGLSDGRLPLASPLHGELRVTTSAAKKNPLLRVGEDPLAHRYVGSGGKLFEVGRQPLHGIYELIAHRAVFLEPRRVQGE